MNVIVGHEKQIPVQVGDILKFKHSGSGGEHGFYLLCHSKRSNEGYFIMNLSGRKSNMKYYDSVNHLLEFHRSYIDRIYSREEWDINLIIK